MMSRYRTSWLPYQLERVPNGVRCAIGTGMPIPTTRSSRAVVQALGCEPFRTRRNDDHPSESPGTVAFLFDGFEGSAKP